MDGELSGDAMVNLSLATTDTWKDKNGEKQEKTEWHRIVIFGKTAEIAGQYLRKGSQIYIEGRLQTRKWTDKEGQERYTTEIVADRMQMLGSRSGGADAPMDREHAPAAASALETRPAQQQRKPGTSFVRHRGRYSVLRYT